MGLPVCDAEQSILCMPGYRTRALICPTNHAVDLANEDILGQLPGEHRNYEATVYPTDDLTAEEMENLPSRTLPIKVGAVVMATENIKAVGLINGARMMVTAMDDNVLVCQDLDDGTIHNVQRYHGSVEVSRNGN